MRRVLSLVFAFAGITCVEAAGVVVLDAANRPLGVYTGPITADGEGVRVMTPQGYAFGLRWSGDLASDGFNPETDEAFFVGNQGARFDPGPYFESNDCSGAGYIAFNAFGVAPPQVSGIVMESRGQRWRIPRDRVLVTREFRSRGSAAQCEVLNFPTNQQATPAIPNDPDVTGVPNEPIPFPIRLGVVGSIDALFSDSFEVS